MSKITEAAAELARYSLRDQLETVNRLMSGIGVFMPNENEMELLVRMKARLTQLIKVEDARRDKQH